MGKGLSCKSLEGTVEHRAVGPRHWWLGIACASVSGFRALNALLVGGCLASRRHAESEFATKRRGSVARYRNLCHVAFCSRGECALAGAPASMHQQL